LLLSERTMTKSIVDRRRFLIGAAAAGVGGIGAARNLPRAAQAPAFRDLRP
jgi:hypothetical protein